MENTQIIEEIEKINQNLPKGLTEELLSLPDQLKGKENKIQGFKFKLSEIKKQFDLWEIREMKSISEEEITLTKEKEEPTKKKRFTNLDSRKAELEIRKENSPKLKSLWESKINAETEQAELEVEINYFKRRLSSLKSMVLLISGTENN